MSDTIYCRNKEEAKRTIDRLGGQNILGWRFLEGGKVLVIVKDDGKGEE